MPGHMSHNGDSKKICRARAILDAFYIYTPYAVLCQNVLQHAEWRMQGFAHFMAKWYKAEDPNRWADQDAGIRALTQFLGKARIMHHRPQHNFGPFALPDTRPDPPG